MHVLGIIAPTGRIVNKTTTKCAMATADLGRDQYFAPLLIWVKTTHPCPGLTTGLTQKDIEFGVMDECISLSFVGALTQPCPICDAGLTNPR